MKYINFFAVAVFSLNAFSFGLDNLNVQPGGLELRVLSEKSIHQLPTACFKQAPHNGFSVSRCTVNINCCPGASTNISIKNTSSKSIGPLVNTLSNAVNFEIYPQSTCNEGVVNLAPGQSCLLRLGGHIAPCVGRQSTLTTSANGQTLVMIQMTGIDAGPC